MTGTDRAAEIGVFARVFPAGPAEQVAGEIRDAGFTVTQLNLTALGRPTLDRSLTEADATAIAGAFAVARVRVWGLSGTFNAIHPDHTIRADGLTGCLAVIERAPALGAEVVTLCTGTRDPDNMWRAHPDNGSPASWHTLRATLDQLIPAAAAAGVRLGIEPEPGNVIVDATAAQRLLTELGDDARHISIVLDPANLLSVETIDQQEAILRSAFDRLGPATSAMHAKDVVAAGYSAPGVGAMDYALVMELHAALPHPVPVIAQDLTADDAGRVHAFLAAHAAQARSSPGST